MIYAFHIDLTVIDLIGEGIFEKIFNLNIPDRAALHGKKIILLADLAPVNHHADALFQHEVKPDPCASAVALPEWVGNVHLNIFLNDFIKGGLRHFVNVGQGCLQVHQWRKTEIALCYVHCPQLAGEVINIAEETPVNGGKGFICAGFKRVQNAAFKELQCPLFAELFFNTGKLSGLSDAEFIRQWHLEPSLRGYRSGSWFG